MHRGIRPPEHLEPVLPTTLAQEKNVAREMLNAGRLAEAVRQACLKAASNAYEDAGISGLCQDGRWECAAQAIKNLDLNAVIEAYTCQKDDS